jgi:chemotaxis receptor (MCP) glutamine deamidase CheD
MIHADAPPSIISIMGSIFSVIVIDRDSSFIGIAHRMADPLIIDISESNSIGVIRFNLSSNEIYGLQLFGPQMV